MLTNQESMLEPADPGASGSTPHHLTPDTGSVSPARVR